MGSVSSVDAESNKLDSARNNNWLDDGSTTTLCAAQSDNLSPTDSSPSDINNANLDGVGDSAPQRHESAEAVQ